MVDQSIERAVMRAIVAMRENLGESLTVDDLARAAMFSKFHFTRVFARATGVSPGRFLSALRLQQAKDLLVSTSLSVADISMRVGYNSVGTFSSRFSRSVGMPPTAYRRRAGYAADIATDPDYRANHPCTARVAGRVGPPHEGTAGMVFVGLFPERIPEGRPVRCAILPQPGPYTFDAVPSGTWYVLAQSLAGDCGPADGGVPARDDADRAVFVATRGPIAVRNDAHFTADLTLQPVQALDPPVLLALLDARKLAMARVAEESAAPARLPLPQAA
jgi:AraC-like DNA-binding protein